jgi:tetratricopeptide (TPR) repeat protein
MNSECFSLGRLTVGLLAAVVVACLSCSPRFIEEPPQPLNPIEVLEKSPRIYAITFKPIADSIETTRASAYLVGNLDYGMVPTDIVLAAAMDSTLRSELTPRETAQLEYYKARRRYEAGSYQTAAYHLKRAMAADESYRPPYLLLGEMLIDRGGLEQAYDLYTKVLSWDRADSDALVGLARCLIRAGKREEAKKALVDAVIFNRINLDAWNELRLVAALEGRKIAYRDAPDLGQVRKVRGRHYKIVIDDSLRDCPVQATAWIAYASERAVWRYEGKYQRRLGVGKYQPTYEEDVDCFMVLAAAWKTLSHQDSIGCETEYLDYLGEVADDGYLVSHVLFDYVCMQTPTAARYFSVEVLGRLRDYVNTYLIVPD